jgi:response regulator of citrate/malate metabolism
MEQVMEILKPIQERVETQISSFSSQMKAVQEEKRAIQEKIQATIRSGRDGSDDKDISGKDRGLSQRDGALQTRDLG